MTRTNSRVNCGENLLRGPIPVAPNPAWYGYIFVLSFESINLRNAQHICFVLPDSEVVGQSSSKGEAGFGPAQAGGPNLLAGCGRRVGHISESEIAKLEAHGHRFSYERVAAKTKGESP